MIRESKAKRFLLKKPVWIVLITLIISIITIPNIITKADVKTLKILEIEPGNKFYLNTEDNVNISGSTYNVEITKVNMPTFISMVDEINGKYDIVVIGRNNNELANSWSSLSKYRDYSSPFLEEWGKINMNFSNAEYNQDSKVLWYSVGGYTPQGINGSADSNKGGIGLGWNEFRANLKSGEVKTYKNETEYTLKEYFSENDITNKRAKQIINMIDSKQLVVFQKSIFSESLNGTKLKENFEKYKDYENVLVADKISIDDILNKYDNEINNENIEIKPEIKVDLISGGDSQTSTKGEKENRIIKYKIKATGSSEKYIPNLILDYNGDGLFSEESSNITIYDSNRTEVQDLNSGEEYTIEYEVEIGFIGYLQWKVEVCSTEDENLKSYLTGDILFKNILDEKININVLQIMPDTACSLNMGSNYTFNNLLKSIDDYNINVKSITIADYNMGTLNDNDTYGINTLENSNYTMVVLGFGDNYGVGTNNQFSDNAISQLLKWNEKKYSLLFTHDTMNLALLDNVKPNTHIDSYPLYNYPLGSRNLTQAFKDIVGQVRYESDLYNIGASSNESTEYPYDEFLSNRSFTTAGITSLSNIRLYSDYGTTNKVNIVNDSQVVSYPFDLINYVPDNRSDIDKTVATTHIQWYQLNLEDENIVPLINLEGISESNKNWSSQIINKGDARNYYYTYAKNNITYSGAGHSNINNPYEMKLFINTMIKAIRGTNKAPEVMHLGEDDQVIENATASDNSAFTISVDQDFNFKTKILDDNNNIGKDIDVNVKIASLTDGSEKELFNNKIKYTDGGYVIDNLVIDTDWLEGREDQIIKVTSKAIDQYEVESEEAVFYVKVEGKKDAQVLHGVNISSLQQEENWSITNLSNNILSTSTVNVNEEVDFAAYIHMYNSNDSIKLKLDDDISIKEMPVVYFVNEDNQLVRLGTREMVYDDEADLYKFDLSKSEIAELATLKDGYCNLVVKYKARIFNDSVYTNNIKLVNQNKSANAVVRTNVNVPNEDLF